MQEMANANPSPSTRFQPGVSGNPKGRPKKTPAFDILMEVVDADPEGKKKIAQMWLDRILKGDYQFFRDYLERSDGKVANKVEVTENQIDWSDLDNEGDTERPAVNPTRVQSLPRENEA
jgi:hypothetical protein